MLAFRRSARPSLSWLALPLAIAACKTKANPASGGPAGSASAQAVETACVAVRPGSEVVLGTQSKKSPTPDEDENAIDLPFSVELGEARAGDSGFVVPAIENRAGANVAVLAVIDGASGRGTVVELGRVHGDVDAPVVGGYRDRWLIAVPDGDVAGLRLKLVSLAPPYTSAELRRGDEIPGARRDTSGYALSVAGDRALLAFGMVEKGHGRISIAQIDPRGPKLLGPPKVLAAGDAQDVEAPRLVTRPSGYYLAYLVWTPSTHHRPLRSGDGPDAGRPDDAIEEGPSALEILPLDEQGGPAGSPRRLSTAGKHVRAFDLAPLGDGAVLVTYREARGPGLDQAEAYAVLVRPDGTFERRLWEVGESTGVPALLVDAAPPVPNRWGWVLVSDEQSLKLAPIGADPLTLGELRDDPALSSSEPLAVHGGRFLTGVASGTQRKLTLWDCSRSSRLK